MKLFIKPKGLIGLTTVLFGLLVAVVAFAPAASATTSSIWSTPTPTNTVATDTNAVTVGTMFTVQHGGSISAVRLYRGAELSGDTNVQIWKVNSITSGVPSGSLVATGTLAKPASFTAGWRTVNLDHPLTVSTNTRYIASYFADNGQYAYDNNYFCDNNGVPQSGEVVPQLSSYCHDNGEAIINNGLYHYANSVTMPDSSYQASNYWVDVVFDDTIAAPTVAAHAGSTAVGLGWDEAQGAASYSVYQATSSTGPFTQIASNITDLDYTVTGLTNSTTYYFKVRTVNGSQFTDSSVVSAIPAATAYRLYAPSETPANFDSTDTNNVNLGVKFTTDTTTKLTGVRFYRDSSAGMANNRVYVFDANGTQVASGLFAGESNPTGWVTVDIYPAVTLPAGSYTASYFAAGGKYSHDTDQLPDSAGPINATVGASVYNYSSTPGVYPTTNYNSSYTYAVTPVLQIGTADYNINSN